VLLMQRAGVAQVPLQVPPQPSEVPHGRVTAQLGAHTHRPSEHVCPAGHCPVAQVPPQPLGPPHIPVVGQVGLHTQRPPAQR
jgi:hypothetical protein